MAIYKIDDLLKKHNTTINKVTNFGSDESILNSMEELKQKEPTFGGKVIRETIRPLANLATNVVNAGQIALGKEETKPFSGEYLGEVGGIGKLDLTKGFTPENIKVLKDSVKAGVDIGVLLSGGAGAKTVAKTGLKEGIIQGAKTGAKTGSIVGGISGLATGLEEDATIGSTLKNVAIGVGGGALTGGVLGGATGAIPSKEAISQATTKAGKGLKTVGEKTYGLTITPTERTAQMVRKYEATQPTILERLQGKTSTSKAIKPTTEANTAARLGLAGTEKGLGVQATKESTKLWKDTISPALKADKTTTNMPTFFKELEKEIVKSNVGTRKSTLLEALEKMKEDYSGVGNVSNTKLQQYKSADWAKFLPDASYKGKPIGAAFKEVQSLAANKAIGILHKKLGKDVSQAYIDYGNLQSIMKSADKSAAGDPALKSVGRNVWQYIMDKVVTPVSTVGGKVLYRTGEGLEFIGQKGAKKVGDIAGITTIPKSVLSTQSQKGLLPQKLKNISFPNPTTKSVKSKGTIPENSLISEAKKYKSAGFTTQQKGMAELSLKVAKEHNVKITKNGDLILYHGTKVGRAPKVGDNWRVGSYFTSDPAVAKQFAGAGNGGKIKIMKVEVPPHTIFPSGDGTYYTLNEKILVK